MDEQEAKFKPGERVIVSRPADKHFRNMTCKVVDSKWISVKREYMYKVVGVTGVDYYWFEHEIDSAEVEEVL